MCWQCLIPVNHQSCRFGWANTNKPRSKFRLASGGASGRPTRTEAVTPTSTKPITTGGRDPHRRRTQDGLKNPSGKRMLNSTLHSFTRMRSRSSGRRKPGVGSGRRPNSRRHSPKCTREAAFEGGAHPSGSVTHQAPRHQGRKEASTKCADWMSGKHSTREWDQRWRQGERWVPKPRLQFHN